MDCFGICQSHVSRRRQRRGLATRRIQPRRDILQRLAGACPLLSLTITSIPDAWRSDDAREYTAIQWNCSTTCMAGRGLAGYGIPLSSNRNRVDGGCFWDSRRCLSCQNSCPRYATYNVRFGFVFVNGVAMQTGNSGVVFNMESVLLEIQRMGSGIVKHITTRK